MSEDVFKKRRAPKCLRQKYDDAGDGDGGVDSDMLSYLVEDRRTRKRQFGADLKSLNSDKKDGNDDKTKKYKIDSDLKMKESGGETQITSFAKETNRTEEDDRLKKYVEDRMAEIKGSNFNELDSFGGNKIRNSAVLFELPDNIKYLESKKKTEESVSDQMLSGIPEVDLGIEAKIKNIEATEKAKMQMPKGRAKDKELELYENYRFNVGNGRFFQLKSEVSQKGDIYNDKSSDDIHFEKFKQNSRKYKK